MRLRADEPEARKIEAVPMCYEADDEEGWVTSWRPDLPDSPTADGEELVTDDTTQRAGFRLVKRSGKVEIKFKANDTSVDN